MLLHYKVFLFLCYESTETVCKLCKDEQLTEKQEVRVFTWIIYELV